MAALRGHLDVEIVHASITGVMSGHMAWLGGMVSHFQGANLHSYYGLLNMYDARLTSRANEFQADHQVLLRYACGGYHLLQYKSRRVWVLII